MWDKCVSFYQYGPTCTVLVITLYTCKSHIVLAMTSFHVYTTAKTLPTMYAAIPDWVYVSVRSRQGLSALELKIFTLPCYSVYHHIYPTLPCNILCYPTTISLPKLLIALYVLNGLLMLQFIMQTDGDVSFTLQVKGQRPWKEAIYLELMREGLAEVSKKQ